MDTLLTTMLTLQANGGAGAAIRAADGRTRFLGLLLAGVALLVLWAGLKAACIAFAVWFRAACPSLSSRMQEAYEERPKRCYVEGVIHFFAGMLIVLLLLNVKPLALLGLMFLLALATMALTGYASAYACLGRKLLTADDSGPKATLLGGVVMEGAFFIPVLGQLMAPAVLAHGLGAAILTLRSRGRKASQPQVPAQTAGEDPAE